MTSISVAYRHSGHFRPLFLKNPAIEETASAVRAQLVAEDSAAAFWSPITKSPPRRRQH